MKEPGTVGAQEMFVPFYYSQQLPPSSFIKRIGFLTYKVRIMTLTIKVAQYRILTKKSMVSELRLSGFKSQLHY